jgi:autotransporter translocation and assembly factor TamB
VTASTEILIGNPEAQQVLIRPLFRSQPDLFDFKDGNWIDCELQVAAGGFRGSFRADLRSEEFQSFLEEMEALKRAVEGTATLSTLEGQIALALTADGVGPVRVTGEAIDAKEDGNRLQFSFEIDQTEVPAICQSLSNLLAAFPAMGVSDAEQA